MFRPVQGHHQERLYKGINKILAIRNRMDKDYEARYITLSNKSHNKKDTIICHLYPSYMFRPVQGHHQERIYKGARVQQILSKMRIYSVKSSP